MLENLPQELTRAKFWVVWKEDPPDTLGKKYKKHPLNALTLNGEGWQFPVNWSHHATALKVFEENPTLRGIGPVFSPDDPYCFFDLDGVVKKGKLLDWAAEFVGMVDSYTEISPSGKGIKIIVRAKLGTRRKSFEFKDSKGDPHEIECYDASRFFAATGDRLQGSASDIEDRQELLDTLHPSFTEDKSSDPLIDRATDEYAEDVDAILDDKLIEKIQASGQATKFKRLMDGNTKGYAGYFAASGALCAILAFWTRANPTRIDRLYRKSKLFEEEWWSERCYSGQKSRSQYVIDAACKKAAAKDMYIPPSSGLITNDEGKIKPIMANAITMLKTTPLLGWRARLQ
jgi:putative DNA primase/helicase